MSKFLKIMIVLLTITAMAAPVVIAADQLTLSGAMRVRAAYRDADKVKSDSTFSGMDQRLRVGGKFTVSENVSVTFRTDFSEGTWGTDAGLGRFSTIKDMDRAHIDLNFGSFALRAGTQYIGFGNMYSVDFQDTALKFTFGSDAVSLTGFYSLYEGNADKADTHFYGANAGFGFLDVFASSINGLDEDVYLVGTSFNFDLDAVKIKGELDYFTGDASATKDAVGLQAFVDVAFSLGETITLGGAAYYVDSADATSEQMYTHLGNGFNGYDPFNHGPLENANLQAYNRPGDIFGNGGLMAAQIYADFKLSDSTLLTSSLVYGVPEDDDISVFMGNLAEYGQTDAAIVANVGISFQLLTNTSWVGQLQYVDVDAVNDHSIMSAGTSLQVNF